MIIKPQFNTSKFCKTIQVEDETFKSNLNIIDLNAGKNLGFKPDHFEDGDVGVLERVINSRIYGNNTGTY